MAAPLGNKFGERCPNVVLRKLAQMYNNAKNDNNVLSFQDACFSVGWRPSKIAYWTSKLKAFELFKKDIQDAIISRINKNALVGDFNATASIWRMKQLGETDQQTVNQTIDMKVETTTIEWAGEKIDV
jgi:hypothetical protein